MTRTDLDAAFTAVLTRWAATLRDTGGRPAPRMLDELAEVAELHADDRAAERISGAALPAKPPAVPPLQPPTSKPAPRRRQPARKAPRPEGS
jgi:hypothetical protein